MWRKYFFIGFALVGCVACNATKTAFEYMPNMMDSPAVLAQKATPRMPVAGTIPQHFEPYPFAADQGDAAGATLPNPLPKTREVFARGQQQFEIYCAVCHGPTAKGDGTVTERGFPRPPSLHSDKVRDWSDGRIFHVITRGQNNMPSYAAKIPPQDRWAIVRYVRALQRAVHPTPADIELIKQQLQGSTP